MEIVQKLFLRVQKNTPSRKEVGEMIMEYIGTNLENIEKSDLSGSHQSNNDLKFRQSKLVVAPTFAKQADQVLRAMIKVGKQSSPLDKIHFPRFLVFIGEPPSNYQIILPINIPDDLKDKIKKQPVYVVTC